MTKMAFSEGTQHSDLHCAYSTGKTGRKITHVDFTFGQNDKTIKKATQAVKTAKGTQDTTLPKQRPQNASSQAAPKRKRTAESVQTAHAAIATAKAAMHEAFIKKCSENDKKKNCTVQS